MRLSRVLWMCAVPLLCAAAGLEINGGFELGTPSGWTEWYAPWASAPSYDYAATTEPFAGANALHLSAGRGSFGVYQEFCVEPGTAFDVAWAWRGTTLGDGWWELLIVDAPYSYDMVDAPSSYPEVTVVAKWEKGLGGAYPLPSSTWVEDQGGITPASAVVTVVLKCGSSNGGRVDAWFDAVTVTHASTLLGITGVTPPEIAQAGGVDLAISGRIFAADAAVTIGGAPLVEPVRQSTCLITGKAPAGAPGPADVVVSSGGESATLAGGITFVAPPQIESIEPVQGPPEGAMPVTIRGRSFETVDGGGVAVTIGGDPLVNTVVVDATTITGTTPPGPPGAADVRVTTPFGDATAAGAFTYVSSVARLRRGDCNNDETVNIADAIALLGHLFGGKPAPACVEACNGNDDTSLNIADAVKILGHLFAGAGPLPAPFPACGEDPTPSLTCGATQSGC